MISYDSDGEQQTFTQALTYAYLRPSVLEQVNKSKDHDMFREAKSQI